MGANRPKRSLAGFWAVRLPDIQGCPRITLSNVRLQKRYTGRTQTGVAATYAAETRALACLETLVHLAAFGLPLNWYLVEITIPDRVWALARGKPPQPFPSAGTPNPPAAPASPSALPGCEA